MENTEFKVNRETFTTGRTVLDASFEQAVERDFVLPDYYPDIFRILKCIVIPKIVSHSINGEKLSYETAVLVRVLYQSENDKRVNCIEQKMNYSKTVDLNGSCTNPTVTINPRCDYVNCRVVNQRRLDIRGAVSAGVKVEGEDKQAVIVDAYGCNIQLRKQLCTYPSKRLTASKRVTVIEELELSASKPPVGAVIRSDCIVFPQEQKMIAGKLITKGDAEISMLYTCVASDGEESLETMKFTIPFSQIIDIDGIEESFEASVDITPASCEIIPKGEDAKTMECELILLVNCVALKYETCEIVTDAYSTCFECEIKNSDCKLDAVPVKVDESHTAVCTVNYSDEGISCVYDSWALTDNVSSRYDEEKKAFIATGNVKFCVIGRNESKDPVFLEGEVPFEHEISLPEGCVAENCRFEPKVRITGCSYYLADSNNIELKAELKIGGSICQQNAKTMLCELNVLTDKRKERQDCYALKLCYCDADDDIWEIAKKYSTSISAIMEENELDDDKVTHRGMLLIPLMN